MYPIDADRYNKMTYRRCGKSGLQFPIVSLGLWHNFGTDADFAKMQAICYTAFNAGITHFDLANNYGPVPGAAEINFGRILQDGLKSHRDELLISTKAGYTMWEGPYGDWGSRKYLIASLDQSLKRMGLDYVDIFYHHRFDPQTPLEETMLALDQIVKSGKALYAGISNYNQEQTQDAMEILRELKCPFVINQRRYSMLDRTIEKDETKAFCAKQGIGLIAFSPLAQGLLSGKYQAGIPDDSRVRQDGRFLKEKDLTEDKRAKIAALALIAQQRGQTMAQLALSWILRDGEVTSVLIGASKPEQVLENCKIVSAPAFTDAELKQIDKILNQ